jgi:hypothetical protein
MGPAPTRDEAEKARISVLAPGSKCWACESTGHIKRDCPVMERARKEISDERRPRSGSKPARFQPTKEKKKFIPRKKRVNAVAEEEDATASGAEAEDEQEEESSDGDEEQQAENQ